MVTGIQGEREYPRVLVICCNPFSRTRNNGLTMLNLFRNWPRDNVAQVYIESATSLAPDLSVCRNYWKLSPRSALQSALGSHPDLALDIGHVTTLVQETARPPLWRRLFMWLGKSGTV